MTQHRQARAPVDPTQAPITGSRPGVRLTLSNISKSFGDVAALTQASLEVAPGEVHALLGENGAGKSTLMHVAYGMLRPDSGTIRVRLADDTETSSRGFASPRAARAAGVGMVHQHFTSIPALTVGENVALFAGWPETGRRAERRTRAVAERLNLPLPVSAYAESLSAQLRQRLEIVKALAAEARILLLDEPTAVLAPREVEELLAFVRDFTVRGGAIVLITHKLDEVVRVADRVTVLRHGAVTLSDAMPGQTARTLSHAMIGADLVPPVRRSPDTGEVLVRGDRVSLRGHASGAGRPAVVAATFEMRAGEVVGVAAIEGNGARELLRAIAGVDDVVAIEGRLAVTGTVAFIPEDRTSEGLIPEFTLAENLQLGAATGSGHWLNWPAIRAGALELLRANDVRADGPDVRAATLSGGNQQRFVLARALQGNPRVIVAEDPTRGLDVLATQSIQERLRGAAQHGAAVIVHSSDLDEVVALADRLLVVSKGTLRELPRDTPREALGEVMLAVEPPT